MKDRIIRIMEHEEMSPSKFAETIGIQRASMSHITNGRNNPSLDVLQKILENFPQVDPDWLLFGKGSMLRGQQLVEPDLFANAGLFSDQSTGTPENQPNFGLKTAQNAPKQIVTEKIIPIEKPSKKIAKIMVFYSDNTYDTFVPEKGAKD